MPVGAAPLPEPRRDVAKIRDSSVRYMWNVSVYPDPQSSPTTGRRWI